MAEDFAGVRRSVHLHGTQFRRSMVIDQIDTRSIFTHQLEHHPQGSGYRDRPLS